MKIFTLIFFLTFPVILLQAQTQEKTSTSTSYIVTSSGDEPDSDLEDGIFDPPTLRSAIQNANLNTVKDEIIFSGITDVSLSSQLPVITNPVVIDGALTGNDKVVINGGGIATDFGAGFIIGPTGGGSELRNLAIINFSLGAININATENLISKNFIGTADGELAQANGDQFTPQTTPAIHVKKEGNVISENVISGNFGYGIRFDPPSDTSTIEIHSNIIGLDSAGVGHMGNSFGGILIDQGKGIIDGNTISDNNGYGILVDGGIGEEEHILEISNNYVGVDITGTKMRGNEFAGIRSNRNNVTIADNIISHNEYGILSYGEFVDIKKNKIGVDVYGSKDFGNENSGIVLYGSASTVGGYHVSDRNIISANDKEGILIHSSANLIGHNFIGINARGDSALGNTYEGIIIEHGLGYNEVINNVISGNQKDGVELIGLNYETILRGNLIGTDSTGTEAIGNSENGLLIIDATGIEIGGNLDEQGNIISNNGLYGIQSLLMTTKPDTLEPILIKNNRIGVDKAGTVAMGNSLAGILLSNWNSEVSRNIIGANTSAIIVQGRKNKLLNNNIGVDATGTNPIGNQSNAVVLQADSNYVGDSFDTESGNIISASQFSGILVFGSSNYNTIAFNYIGVDGTGIKDFGNGRDGITFGTNSTGNLIQGNLISGNSGHGIKLQSKNSNYGIYSNFIGISNNGQDPIPNTLSGIYINQGDDINIGRSIFGEGNVISGNDGYGIELEGHNIDTKQKGIRIKNNEIGVTYNGVAASSNKRGGVKISNQRKVTLGGKLDSFERNIIAGNDTVGVYVVDPSPQVGLPPDSILILGNYIGLDESLNPIPNIGPGIYVLNYFEGGKVFIGKDSLNQGNVIAHNEGVGIGVLGERIVFMDFNRIFDNGFLGIDLNYDGVTFNDEDDSDEGANLSLNFPVIGNATYNEVDETVTIFTEFQSIPGSFQYYHDYYYNQQCDEFGFGEAEYYLDTKSVITDPQGFSEDQITIPLPFSEISHLDGIYITSNTATTTIGSSELSECFYIALKGSGGNEPDLVLNKTDSLKSVEGSDVPAMFTYQITVKNIGAIPAYNVVLTDTIPENLNVGDITISEGEFSFTEQILTVELDSLLSGDSLLVVIPVETETEETVVNIAYVTSDTPETNTANNHDSDSTVVSILVNNEEDISELPKEFILNQNYPNPFNPSTTISYSVPRRANIEISIFNILGMKVATLVDEVKQPGTYSIDWDAGNFASDVYFYRLKTEGIVRTKKMTLIK